MTCTLSAHVFRLAWIMQMLEVSRLRAGAIFHPSWGRGLIRARMDHSLDVIVSSQIHTSRFQDMWGISMRTITELEMTELDLDTSSL